MNKEAKTKKKMTEKQKIARATRIMYEAYQSGVQMATENLMKNKEATLREQVEKQIQDFDLAYRYTGEVTDKILKLISKEIKKELDSRHFYAKGLVKQIIANTLK